MATKENDCKVIYTTLNITFCCTYIIKSVKSYFKITNSVANETIEDYRTNLKK